MSAQFTQIAEQLGTVAAALAGAFLAINKTKSALMGLSNTKPLVRKAITADLQLLKLMNETDPGYEELRNHIKSQVHQMIKEGEKKELIRGNLAQILVGFLMAGGFGYWTYHIGTQPTSNWWMILTGWMALAGIGFLAGAFTKPSPDKGDAADARTSQG